MKLLLSALFVMAASISASPPSPDLVNQYRETGKLQELSDRMAAAHKAGWWPQMGGLQAYRDSRGETLKLDLDNTDTIRVVVLMVDFDDNPASHGLAYGQPSQFQQILFSNSPYDTLFSLTEFYLQNSYGSFVILGDVYGWYRMPERYDYYVDGQNGWGECPRCAMQMATDAVTAADPDVDFSIYYGEGPGRCDGLFILFAGRGADETGSDFQIWPHMSGIWNDTYADGVQVTSYSMEPEERDNSTVSTDLCPIGVFCHEFGHILGLPDLYDTDYSSNGCGYWGLMSFGSWNWEGFYPAFLLAHHKEQLGFLDLINVQGNLTGISIPDCQYNPIAYRIWQDGEIGSEYFVVENRQKTGFDMDLPGSGLQISHIDLSVWSNDDESHYRVAIEQADGRFDLESDANRGDPYDLWTNTVGGEFTDLSTPNSRRYDGSKTKTAVWDISRSDSVMTANLDITYSRPYFELPVCTFSDATYGNGNGIPEAGETLEFTFAVRNLWETATNTVGLLSADNNDIVFNQAQSFLGTVPGEGGVAYNTTDPITFTIPSGFDPCIDSFYLELACDNPSSTREFGMELHIGSPDILVVDDDYAENWESAYTSQLYQRRIPFQLWEKQTQGSPSAAELNKYKTVIWFSGPARYNIINAADIAALQSFLDGGGNLFLTGQTVISDLSISNPGFLQNYLKCVYDSTLLWPVMYGIEDSPLGNGIKIRYGPTTNQTAPELIDTTGGSIPSFRITTGEFTALSYEGDYRLVIFSFGFEAISDEFTSSGYTGPDVVFDRILDFFYPSESSLNPTVTETGIVGELSVDRVISHTPTFYWQSNDTTDLTQSQYEISVGTGSLCYSTDNLWADTVHFGADTSITYAGLPLEDGESYRFNVKVSNSETWSELSHLDFAMNAVPEPNLMISPIDDTVIASTVANLRVFNAQDPEGDPVTYYFELYDDGGLEDLISASDGIPAGSPTTSWTAVAVLSEDQQYFWRYRVFDGFEFSDYSETASFWVNTANQQPQSFDLAYPPNGDSISEPFPVLSWHPAIDPDPGDWVNYRVHLAQTSDFALFDEIESYGDTSVTAPFLLDQGVNYYWRVKAADTAGAEVYSESVRWFYLGEPQCCSIRGDINSSGAQPDISDLVYLVTYMFRGGPAPICPEHADINGSGSEVDIADLVMLVTFMFQGGPPPASCP